MAGGMPLAFTQEDFLVKSLLIEKNRTFYVTYIFKTNSVL